MKLRSKILVYTLPLILLPLILLALANYYFIIRADLNQAQEAEDRGVSAVVTDIQQELEKARKDTKLLASVPAVLSYLSSEDHSAEREGSIKSSARDALKLFFQQNPYYLELVVVDSIGNERIKFSRLTEESDLKNVGSQDYFKSGLVSFTLDHFQTPVQLLDGIKYATVFSANVADGKFRGMVVLKLNLEVFKRNLKSLLAQKGSAVMFDDRGVVFAQVLDERGRTQIPNAQTLSEAARKIVSEDVIIGQPEIISSDENKTLFFAKPAYFLPRESMHQPKPGGKWFIGVLHNDQTGNFFGEFTVLFFSVLGIAVAALFLVTRKIAERVTVPIETVNNATALIGRGSYDLDLEIKTGDEIEDLAEALKTLNGDLIEYQKQLVQSAKLATIGEMASEISHEIQNRISGLSLWLQCLDNDSVTEEQRKQYVDEMKQGLGGFMTMLATLKQYYQTPVLELEVIGLNKTVLESLPFVEEEIALKKIAIKKSLAQNVGLVKVDAEKIKSVFINLILNAIDAVETGGKIELATGIEPQSDRFFISVKDNGCGITDEDISRVFYPFYTTKDGGSGLGLAVCSNIISAHGGEIKVKSEIGKGTEIRVLLNTGQNHHA